MRKKNKASLVKDSEFVYGTVEMTNEEYREALNPKIRTTIFLEESLISAYKKEAVNRGIRYQQLLREVLHKGLAPSSGIEARLCRLEAKVLKKRP